MLKKRYVTSAIVLIIICISLIGIITVIYNNVNDVCDNPNKYLQLKKYPRTDLDYFPKKIVTKNVIAYKHYIKTGLIQDYIYIYLKYKYNSVDEYNKEITRIKRIKTQYSKTRENYKLLKKKTYVLYFGYYDCAEIAIPSDKSRTIEYLVVQYPEEFSGERYVKRIINSKDFYSKKNDGVNEIY